MPLDRYIPFRKAAEIEEINQRIIGFSDLIAAFSMNTKHIQRLNQMLTKVQGLGEDEIHFEKDINAAERMKRWQR